MVTPGVLMNRIVQVCLRPRRCARLDSASSVVLAARNHRSQDSELSRSEVLVRSLSVSQAIVGLHTNSWGCESGLKGTRSVP